MAVLANLAFSIVLMDRLESAGLALATALASMLNVGILIVVLNRRLGGVDWRSVGRSATRTALATAPLIVACVWVAGAEVWVHEGEWIGKTVMLAVGIGLSVTGYVGVHALLRSEELDVVWGMVRRKAGR